MHPIQERILKLAKDKNLGPMNLRQIGLLISEEHPQKVKHHLGQLEKRGLVTYNRDQHRLKAVQADENVTGLINVPIMGAANCGKAAIFADNYLEGYLKISPGLLKKTIDIYAIEASGDSMNQANIDGKNIEDGDYVVVDSSYNSPESGHYVVSLIDGMANIKKFYKDTENSQIVLMPESTKNYSPIYIGLDEIDSYRICGRVMQVIKKPKF